MPKLSRRATHWVTRFLASGVVLAASLPGAPSVEAAVSQTAYRPVGDAYVSSVKPTTNYGTLTAVKADSSPVIKSFMKFTPTLDGPLRSATLRLHTLSSSSSNGIQVAVAGNSWDERTVIHNTAPAITSTPSVSSGGFSSGQWLSLDVTRLITSSGPVTLAITTNSTSSKSFASREDAARAPQLIVETGTPDAPPSNVTPPEISGVAEVGQTLTASKGTWAGAEPMTFVFQWLRCDAAGSSCVEIPAATTQSLLLTDGDAGYTVRERTTATNSVGTATATSSNTGVVAAKPAPVSSPTPVTGSPTPTTGASPTGSPAPSPTTSTSAPVPPANESVPTISGSAQAGTTLTADNGAWAGTQPMTYSYSWKRCGGYARTVKSDAPVSYWRLGEMAGSSATDSSGNARAGSYAGARLGVPGALNADHNTAASFDGISQKVTVPDDAALRLNGSFGVEFWAKLDSLSNSWPGIMKKGLSGTGNTGYLVYYGADLRPVFKRAGVDGPKVTATGALSTTEFKHYFISYDGATSTLRWYVNGALNATFTNVNYAASSDVSALELGRGDQYGRQTLDEVALYDRALTAERISAHYNSAASGCKDVGSNSPGYTLDALDVDARIHVVVTATNTAGSASAAAAETAAVVAAGTPLAAPTLAEPPYVDGLARSGKTLTARPGLWKGTDPIDLTYRWRRCNATGSACAEISGATASTYTLTSTDQGSTFRALVEARNAASTARHLTEPTGVVSAATASHPTIAAAGDIACDPLSSSFNAGAGTSSSCRQMAVSDLFMGAGLSAVLPLGDIQYECGSASAYAQSYDPSWGRVKAITRPTIGNHEYAHDSSITQTHTTCTSTEAEPAKAYFDYFGSAAGTPQKSYYSYDIGDWHLISLNSECSATAVGGCGIGSPQQQWLQADLAANTKSCVLAYWHRPRWSSVANYDDENSQVFWRDLYDAGADVVLAGHAHLYERFAKQNAAGQLDPRGIRQFIVGTGGKSHHQVGEIQANSQVRDVTAYGALKLTLKPTSYDWEFAPEAGKTFTDAGSGLCN